MKKPNSPLSQFIEEYPLYTKFGTDQPIEPTDLNNLAFNFYCKNEKEVQPFRLAPPKHNSNANGGAMHPVLADEIEFTEIFTGVCQSCELYHVSIIINGGGQKEKPKYFIRKIGQLPAPEPAFAKLPADVLDMLDDQSCEYYQKALKNLESGLGAGALVYFSKLMRRETGRIVEALSNLYFPDGHKIADAFMSYNEKRQKTRFIEEITPLLPGELKKHGANILLVLNDAAGLEIHDLKETDCIKRAKDIDTMFRYLARKITEETHSATVKKADKYFLRYR